MDNTEHIIQELRSEKWEMAQEIERLREQERKMTNHALERMEEIERLREEHHDIRILNEQYFNENDILIAEIERLREALQTLTDKCLTDFDGGRKLRRGDVEKARSALQQKESE